MLKVGYLLEALIACYFGISFSFSSTSFQGIEEYLRPGVAHRSELVSRQLELPLISTVLLIQQIVFW